MGGFLSEHDRELFPETRQELAGSAQIKGAELARAWHELRIFRAQMASFFERYDLLLTPATAVAAFAIGEPPSEIGGKHVEPGWMTFMPFSVPWNITGQPTASVPCGRTADGLPIGLTLIARRYDEAIILCAAAAFSRARPWSDTLRLTACAGGGSG